jgi:hypothetical protein
VDVVLEPMGVCETLPESFDLHRKAPMNLNVMAPKDAERILKR